MDKCQVEHTDNQFSGIGFSMAKCADETLELQIVIVKYIVSVKLAENVSLTWSIKYCGLVGFISGQFT